MKTSLLRFVPSLVWQRMAGSLCWLALAFNAAGQGGNPLQIHCPSNLTHWICGGSFAFVDYPTPTTTGSCSAMASVSCSPPSGSIFVLGTTTVTCRATNSCRESAVCSFTITVAHDTTPPVIQCPGNITVPICGTASAIPVTFPMPTATDNAGTNVSVVCTPPSGSLFPVGTTTVICTATDDCTNRSTCTFTVTVRPALLYRGLCHTPLGLAKFNVNTNGELEVSGLGASGADGVRIDLGESQGLGLSYRNSPRLTEGDLDVQILGRNTAGQEIQVHRLMQHYEGGKLIVTPSFGYEVKLLLRGEIVYRRPANAPFDPVSFCTPVQNSHCVPEVNVPGFLYIGGCFSFVAIECTSETEIGPVLADTMVIEPEPPGPQVTALTAVQILGRNHPGFKITSEETLPALRIVCPPNVTVQSCSTNPVAVTFPPPVVTGGNCISPAMFVCVPPSGSLFPPGTTTVRCTATNACLEVASCSFTVTVLSTLVYQSESEPNNALGSAKDLGLASFVAVAGRISPAGDVDYYRFSAAPNSRAWITVDTGGAQWLGANSRDSVLTLYNGAGAVIETDDNDGSGNGADSVLESGDASAIAGAALAGGTYYLSVAAAGTGQIIAPYRLYLTVTTNTILPEVEPNDTATTATTLVPWGLTCGVRSGNLNPASDSDWYTVNVPGPSLLHISVDGDPERAGTGTDTRVELFRKDAGSILFFANSSAAGAAVAEGFVYRLSVPGTYYVRVRTESSSSIGGPYRIMVAHCPLPLPPPLGIVHRGGILTFSWPAALEPCVLRSSRDLRTWKFLDLTPAAIGDELRAELPSTQPNEFFQIVPAGGWSNDTYHCCDANGQNCSGPVGPIQAAQCPHVVWCYETENSSVCVPQ